ncbi:RecQ family ATP-dependent DNA helicase [Domibacillus iocasae]|uniref:ATP-dependent DNA helicase n=1 Tax=Domibacillus iocasae TaxID=1714016 RepID=A0A1E7DN28_9BACI|nr:ATP-dependent DNA helicase RecQ [Domibacillus iocasae]OES44464.1 ATP-dependent DNA helicase [Domibacillus iocasae]
MTIDEHLHHTFGFSSFRPGQRETIESLLNGRHTLSMLPTGTGKSLCYQLPGLMLDGAVLIVSPLLSLMQDQVEQLKIKGEKRVIALNSFLQYEEKHAALSQLEQYKFIFLSPEMLQLPYVISALCARSIALFVVDEAHCISQWGYDFRPDYGLLGKARKELGNPLTLALTATADKKVRSDIRKTLCLDDVSEWVFSVNRPNIAIDIEVLQEPLEKQKRLQEIVHFLQKPGIVYFSGRKSAEEAVVYLKQHGITRTAFYHGGMDIGDRLLIQHQFLNGDLDVVCATSAFGMGINKGNVRFVIHYHLPSQMEAYLQEIGRAGRDGKPAISILLYVPGDEKLHEFIAESEFPDEGQIRQVTEYGLHPRDVQPPLSETQERFLVHYAKAADQHRESRATFIKDVRTTLLERKAEKRFQMKRWIEADSCRRAAYMQFFDEPPPNQLNCCDRCGFDRTLYKESRQVKEEADQLNWRERLNLLLPGH